MGMFHGTTARGWKGMDPFYFFLTPSPAYVVTFLTAWSLVMLWVKGRKLKLQRRALGLNLIPTDDPGFILTPASAEHVLDSRASRAATE